MPKLSLVKFTPVQPYPKKKLPFQFISYEVFQTKFSCPEVRTRILSSHNHVYLRDELAVESFMAT